ncbi:MAG: NAD(P)-dependent oxidoreductase [Candidatus Zixiibacteriota bacterium]
MPVGFIGLGHLGKAIAQRLIDCGEELLVYNRTAAKAEGIKAKRAGNIDEMALECETIVFCLFDSSAVAAILPQVLARRPQERLIVDLTTNRHRQALDFHRACSDAGAEYLEAPVLGSVAPATRGELTILVSGGQVAFQRANALLAKIGKTIHFLGDAGAATKMKLINNHLLGTFMAAIAEAIALGERAGISRKQVIDILSAGAGNSGVFNAKKEKLLNGDYSPHFSAALIYKDLGYLLELAHDLGHDANLAQTTRQLYERTTKDDPHARDFSVIFEYLK